MDNLSQKIWSEQENRFFKKLYAQGAANYLAAIPNFDQSLRTKDRLIRCIDEGTPGGIHAAGSLILLSKLEALEFIRNARPEGITSHADCGAARLACKEKGLNANDDRTVESAAVSWAKEIAKLADVPYAGHIAKEELSRPAGQHIARTVYYAGVPAFDPQRIEKLPPGFVISRRQHSAGNALTEVEISLDIALGGHGFGGLITKRSPILLIVIGDKAKPEFCLENLKNELLPVVSKKEGLVVLDGIEV